MTTPRWLFRVASHPRHGGGHVARSGVLAAALAARGEEVLMVLDDGAGEARARLEARTVETRFSVKELG